MPTHKEKFSVCISLKLHKTQTKSPAFNLKLNGQDIDICDPTNISATAKFGENILRLEFTNKDNRDTKVDQDGNIVEDLAVEIEKCLVDQMDFTSDLKNNGVYQTKTGIENTYGFLYTNGIFSYQFTCPGFYHVRNLGILS
jgi:hypothetical protein